MKLNLLSGLACIAVLTACTQNAPSSPAPTSPAPVNIAQTEWGPESNPDIFIRFDHPKAVGSGGCNNFFAEYLRAGSELSFGPVGATKKMCAPDIMQAEHAFFEALSKTQFIDITEQRLILKRADGTELVSLQRRDWD